ncbi:hypothetical protein, partial [Burkholderia multivorans]
GAGAGAVPAVGRRGASGERRGSRCARQVVVRRAVTVVGLASDATLDWLCDARRKGAAPVHGRRSPLYVFLIALFSLAPISRLTSRFVDESRFCFCPSTEHRAQSTEHRAPTTERRSAIAAAAPICTGGEKRARRSSAPAAAKRSAPGRYHRPARRFCTVPLPAILVKANRRRQKEK